MNIWLLIYIIGVILFFILSLIIGLKEEYEDVHPHTLKYVNWERFINWLLGCFFLGCVLSVVGAFFLLLHLCGIITIQRK